MIDIPPETPQYDEFGRPIVKPNYTPIQPNFSPIHINPAPATPAEAQMASLPLPDRSNFHNSKIRTVLNAIAGGLAGASGGPKIGMEVGQNLHDAPYNRAMESYQNRVARLKTIRESEKEQVARAEKEQQLGIQKGTGEATADYKGKTIDINQQKADTASSNATSLASRRASLTKQGQQRLDKLPPHLQEAVDFTKLSEEEQDAVTSAVVALHPRVTETPEEAAAKATAVQQAKDKQAVTPEGKAANQSRSVTRITATGTPEALNAEESAAAARTRGSEGAKLTPEMIAKQADLTRAKSLATLTANEKDTSHKAQIALQAFPDVRKQLDAVSDDLFSNRWKDFVTKTLGKEDSEKYAALRANVELLQTLVSQVHTGNRGVSKILDKFTNLFNVNKMTRKTFIDSITEVEKWLKRYSTLPTVAGGLDLGEVDKQVDANPSKYNIRINK